MKKRIYPLLAIFLTSFLMACVTTACNDSPKSPDNPYKPAPRTHVVERYILPSEDQFDIFPAIDDFELPLPIPVPSDGIPVSRTYRRFCMYFSSFHEINSENRPAEYMALAQKYGDINPDNVIVPDSIPPTALSSDITGINLITLDDYDAGHPAGSSLNDIALFIYSSTEHYIKAGYRMDEETYSNGLPRLPSGNEFVKYPNCFHTGLSETDNFPLRLVHPKFIILYFKSLPTNGDVYRMVIEIEFEDDIKVTKEFTTYWI